MPCGWEKNITLYDCRRLQYVKGWMDGWVGGWMDGWMGAKNEASKYK
jgi:hypothetical protein